MILGLNQFWESLLILKSYLQSQLLLLSDKAHKESVTLTSD